ncbi:MAG: hypothetical protein KDJ97_36900 [Anaerolineae bacterium]|nr:hypothetical protein [Anaerolineae bacterium]
MKIDAQTEGALKTAEANDTRIYHPTHNSQTGGALPTIFLAQLQYWWHKEWDGRKPRTPFYKFVASCDHPLYASGDSWAEELGISKTALASYFKKFGKKLKDSEWGRWAEAIAEANRQELENETDPVYFVYWTRRTDNLTFWAFNDEAYLRMRIRAYGLSSHVNLDRPDVNLDRPDVNLDRPDVNFLISETTHRLPIDYAIERNVQPQQIDIHESGNSSSLSFVESVDLIDSEKSLPIKGKKSESISMKIPQGNGNPADPTKQIGSAVKPQSFVGVNGNHNDSTGPGGGGGSRWRPFDSMSREEIVAELLTLPGRDYYEEVCVCCGYDWHMLSKSKRIQVLEAAKKLWRQRKQCWHEFTWRDWWDQADWRSKGGVEPPNTPQIVLDTWGEYERQLHYLKTEGKISEKATTNDDWAAREPSDYDPPDNDLADLIGGLEYKRNLYRYWSGEIEIDVLESD